MAKSSANGLVGTGFASRYHSVTNPDGAVAKSLANGLVGTGFIPWYQLQPPVGF